MGFFSSSGLQHLRLPVYLRRPPPVPLLLVVRVWQSGPNVLPAPQLRNARHGLQRRRMPRGDAHNAVRPRALEEIDPHSYLGMLDSPARKREEKNGRDIGINLKEVITRDVVTTRARFLTRCSVLRVAV